MDLAMIPSKIMLVDDDLTMQKIITMSIMRTRPDIEIMAVDSGECAISEARQKKPDLVILDYRLKGIDGIETYKALQNIEYYQTIPFIFMSGEDNLDVQSHDIHQNIKGVIHKPFKPTELGNDICELLLS